MYSFFWNWDAVYLAEDVQRDPAEGVVVGEGEHTVEVVRVFHSGFISLDFYCGDDFVDS